MKKILFITLLALFCIGCSSANDDECNGKIVTVHSIFTMIDSLSDYTGPIEVYPCITGTYIYKGNYTSTAAQSAIPAYYYISNGIGKATNYPLREPIGKYTLIYWGYPNWKEEVLRLSNVRTPEIILDSDMSNINFSLLNTSVSDTLYHPVYDMVVACQTLNIDTDNLSANFQRATAGINVSVINSDNTAFSSTIDSMWVYIGGINYQINFATGLPTNNSYKTVVKSLSPNSVRTHFLTDSTYVFPSTSNPPLQLFVKMRTGTVKKFKTYLTNQLEAGTFTTLVIYLNSLMIEKNNTCTLTIDSWIEQQDSITFPVI